MHHGQAGVEFMSSMTHAYHETEVPTHTWQVSAMTIVHLLCHSLQSRDLLTDTCSKSTYIYSATYWFSMLLFWHGGFISVAVPPTG